MLKEHLSVYNEEVLTMFWIKRIQFNYNPPKTCINPATTLVVVK